MGYRQQGTSSKLLHLESSTHTATHLFNPDEVKHHDMLNDFVNEVEKNSVPKFVDKKVLFNSLAWALGKNKDTS